MNSNKIAFSTFDQKIFIYSNDFSFCEFEGKLESAPVHI